MLSIRKGGVPDFPAISELHNIVWPHHHRGLQEFLRDEEVMQPECRPYFWLAEWDETLVGFAEANRNVASYHPKKWLCAVSVLPDHRHRGVGSQLHDEMVAFLDGEGLLSLTVRLSDADEPSLQFAQKRDYEEVKRDFESELDLQSLDCGLLAKMAESPAEIRSVANLDSPDFRKEMHEVFEIVRVDTPRAEPPTPLTFEQFQTLVLDDPEFLKAGSQIALVEGRVVGFSGIYHTEVEGQLFQWLTAVKREHRGKGVAQALKSHSAQWAIANGYRTVRTDNDIRNGPMLAINNRMGFRNLPGMITLVKRFGSESPELVDPSPADSA